MSQRSVTGEGPDVRVLLVSPPAGDRAQGDFGLPHLVALGSYLHHRTGARVEVLDLDYERFLPTPDPGRALSPEFAVVGISCYSSFDYLAAFYLAREIRRHNPGAVLVAGGYHASARPEDFLHLPGSALDDPSPFDHVVVGEGESPLARIVEAAARGQRLAQPVLGPEPLASLDNLPPLAWRLLDRYRPVARAIGSQAALSFSRGCPFGCTFCMERSKGESTWRAWSPGRAESELRALNQWLDLKGWKLFIADALFGLHPDWRREMLDRLPRMDLGLDKIWTLSRIDLIGPQDAEAYHRAGFGVGLGLESGDPEMLARMGKTARPDEFLARFLDFARHAARIGLPWGANMILGHPGETADSLRRSAEFAQRLFLGTKGLTGFLSLDPFRFYPGSLVDRQLPRYAQHYGTRVYRPRWWNYSEQAFTAEWVDPSAALDYRERVSLGAHLFEPIVKRIRRRFAYRGPARDYFLRSVRSAGDEFRPPHRVTMLGCWHRWRGLTGRGRSDVRDDPEARELLRRARGDEVRRIVRHSRRRFPPRLVEAVIDEPRERYLPPEQAADSWRDEPIALAPDGQATISALHAYLTNFALLDLQPGDRLVEVGGGTGYGAALAARLVGEKGSVVSFEIDPQLAAQAEENLRDHTNVTILCSNGLAPPAGLPAFNKAVFSCAIPRVPAIYLDALPDRGRLAAPLLTAREETVQTLTRFVRAGDRLVVTRHGCVQYVLAKDAP